MRLRLPADNACLPTSHIRRLVALAAAAALPSLQLPPAQADAPATVKMEGLRGAGKSTTFFPDFDVTSSGLQYKDFKAGSGVRPKNGDRVLVDWTGVTIGYQGRYFQTRNKPKGGAFADNGFDAEYLVFDVGDGSVIPAIDECVRSMQPGAIRRISAPRPLFFSLSLSLSRC